MESDKMLQNATDSEELSPIQFEAITLMALGVTATDTAEQLGIHRGTLYRWKEDPVFAAQLTREKMEHRERIRDAYCRVLDDAIETCHGLMADSSTPAWVRLKAALSVLRATGVLDPEIIAPSASEVVDKTRPGG